MPPLITLLTDFGTADGYVGEVKGMLLAAAPAARLVDISHDIRPHDVEGGRLALARYWRRFPAGTVHLAVVDPGVGSHRAAIAVHSGERFLVGPDNGLLSPALLGGDARVVELPVPAGASPTFHGRDVFAPAAARLASGEPLERLGAPRHDPVIRRTPEARRNAAGQVEGVVLTIDRFGNAITNLVAPRGRVVRVHGRDLRICRAYADLDVGEAGALVGSSGLLEIVVREGSAAEALGLGRGTVVLLAGAGAGAGGWGLGAGG